MHGLIIRLLFWLRDRVRQVVDRLHLSRATLWTLRRLSMLGVVLGLTVVAGSALFPELARSIVAWIAGDISGLSSFLVLENESLIVLSVGMLLLLGSALLHFLLDIYMSTLGVPWRFTGKSYRQFLVLASFTVTLVVARLIVIRSGIVGPSTSGIVIGPFSLSEVWIQGYHVHHFFYGFVALAFVGWAALFHDVDERLLSVVYGSGMAVFVDEIGMLLTEGEYFASPTYYVAFLFAGLLLAGISWDRLSQDERLGLEDVFDEPDA